MLQRLQQVPGPRTCSRDYSIREPTLAVKAALHQLLTHDDERFFSRVYTAIHLEGIPPKIFAKRAGHPNTSATTVRVQALEILAGKAQVGTASPATRQKLLMEVRYWLRTHSPTLPLDARDYLLDLEKQLSQRVKQPSRGLARRTTTVDTPGVYVYTYPRYQHGDVPLLKVGASGTDISRRVAEQRRNTPVPERLIVVLRFPCDEPFRYENEIHNRLKRAGCYHQANTGATEWFRTTIEHVEEIAASLGLVHRD